MTSKSLCFTVLTDMIERKTAEHHTCKKSQIFFHFGLQRQIERKKSSHLTESLAAFFFFYVGLLVFSFVVLVYPSI